MVLQFSSHHPECVVEEMVVDVDLGDSRGGAGGHPLLVHVVVHHDGGARRRDALLRTFVTEKVREKRKKEEML